MPHLLANVAGQVESTARAESTARRSAREAAPTGDDAFAAILDRASTARGDAARPRVVDELASREPLPASAPESDARPAIVARVAEATARPQPQKTQQNRPPARSGDAPDPQPTAQAAAPNAPRDPASEATERAIGQPGDAALPADTTTTPPDAAAQRSDTGDQPSLPTAAPAPVQFALAPVMPGAQQTSGVADDPTLQTAPPAAPLAGPMPLPDMPAEQTPPRGPTPPGEALASTSATPSFAGARIAHAADAAPRIVEGASAFESLAPISQPSATTGTAGSAANLAPSDTEMPGEAPPSSAASSAAASTAAQGTFAARLASASPASEIATPSAALTPLREAAPRRVEQGAPSNALAIDASVVGDAAEPSAAQPTARVPASDSPSLVRVVPVQDGAPMAPPLSAGLRGATADDAPPAGRSVPTRNAAQPGTALAAQLAQQEAGAQAMPPGQVALPAPTVATEPTRPLLDQGGSQSGLVDDEVAPVRHAIALPAEASAAPSRVDATADTAAARTARMTMHPAIAQVAVSVTKAVQEGVDRITIKLQPPELGRIDVRIEVGVDGRIQAVFAAERQATVEILQRDVRELERALQNAGLGTDAGSLSFGLKQQGGQNANAFAAFQRNDHGPGRGAAGDDDAPVAARPLRAAADGRLDIHV